MAPPRKRASAPKPGQKVSGTDVVSGAGTRRAPRDDLSDDGTCAPGPLGPRGAGGPLPPGPLGDPLVDSHDEDEPEPPDGFESGNEDDKPAVIPAEYDVVADEDDELPEIAHADPTSAPPSEAPAASDAPAAAPASVSAPAPVPAPKPGDQLPVWTADGASIYDAKPVHVISTIHTVATLVDKERVVWRPEEGKRMKVSFPRLNIIDDYN